MNKIVVETGATNTSWCAICPDGSVLRARTLGINLSVMGEEAVTPLVEQAAAELCGAQAGEVHFYAAGLIEAPDWFDALMKKNFPAAQMEYASDLLAAARAVCGHKAGIAAIMGTGSNSCLFDGEKVVKNIHSCGFILGDQGGGAVLGKRFMSDFLQERVPKDLAAEFASAFDVSYATVVKNVYRGDAPSRYLGSFAPWINSHYDTSDYVKALVEDNFRSFITGCLKRYLPEGEGLPVGIVGGLACFYKDLITRIGAEEGVRIDRFYNNALEGLIEYHR